MFSLLKKSNFVDAGDLHTGSAGAEVLGDRRDDGGKDLLLLGGVDRRSGRSRGLGAAAGAGAAGLDLLLRTDPMTVVRTMMQIRPKNTVPMPIRVTKSGLYIDSSYPFR